jgi:hypothetical protein
VAHGADINNHEGLIGLAATENNPTVLSYILSNAEYSKDLIVETIGSVHDMIREAYTDPEDVTDYTPILKILNDALIAYT